MTRSICVALAFWIAVSGCGGKKRTRVPVPARIGSAETGIASWYGYPYHGRRAANGEIYDMEKMTAAHRTLPFGTWVRVKNLANSRTVEVRVTDRGPFVGGRILDLSHAAAVALDMIGPGTARVKITVIRAPEYPPLPPPATTRVPSPAPSPAAAPPTTPAPSSLFAVQVGSYTDRGNAERVRSSMESRYGIATIVKRDAQPVQWRVLVGRAATAEDAEMLADRIRGDSSPQPGDQSGGSFVVRLDNEPPSDGI
jgi:rare lipoprotein A